MKRRPTLVDKIIENLDQRIKWLQLERSEILELQATLDSARTARTTKRATAPTPIAPTAR